MLDIVNKGDFNPGCIYRMSLENFVTYNKCELFPGKSLNLIIGPNGTGKSTFVCAIILGLCGKPIDLGKKTEISTFIKRGNKSASIEIELYNKKGMKNIIIKRIIEKNDSSHWYINNVKVTEKKVRDIIQQFNIQVDNLCQLLPQDKVQEFSDLKPKELLESTLKAVGRHESIKQWYELIKLKNELLNLTKNLKRDEKNLEKLMRSNESLKQKIEENEERKQIEREIQICEKKQVWLESQELKTEVGKWLQEKKEAEKLVETCKERMKPLKNDLERLKNAVSQLESQKLSSNREIQKLKDQLKKYIQSFETKENQLKQIDTLYEEKLNNYKLKESELRQAKLKMDKLNGDKLNIDKGLQEMNVQDENHLKLELETIIKNRQSVKAEMDNRNKHLTDRTSVFDREIRLYGDQIRQMEDVQTKRLKILNRHREDTYEALMWLEDNRDKFTHPVYKPMMLEINFKHPMYARYLESTVPAKDLIAFTFESTDDMNLFNSIVRKELKLKLVNAVCSEGGELNIKSRDLQNLSHLGFNTCLLDEVIAPAPILRYLCNMYGIDKIPIGNNHTYNNSHKVPENIRFFFSENHRYTIHVSAYGTKSSTTIEIKDPSLLANTVDEQQIKSIKDQLEKSRHEKLKIEHETTEKLHDFENKLQKLEHSESAKRKLLDKIKSINMQINLQKHKIHCLENEPTIDIEHEKELCKEKYKDYVLKQCNVHSEIYNIMNEIHNKILIKMKICMIQIEAKRDEILKKELTCRKLKDELQAATTKLYDIENNLKKTLSKTRKKWEEMLQAFDNKLPTGPSFPYAKEFKDLPEKRHLLMEYRDARLTKISCMENIDSQTIKDYEDSNKEIERITRSLNTCHTTTTKQKDRINNIKSEWLPPLESFIEELSSKFTQMFEGPARAGELTLHKGNGDEDFASYGIHIMVKFRQNEPLSVLTRHKQSGGERALSTAVYMLALQARTVAPFRCVDEINQGLDDVNERQMLQLMIRETTKSNSQYFILSPTLLLDLEYNNKVMVHTVMNGKHILDYKEWNNEEFLRRARNMLN